MKLATRFMAETECTLEWYVYVDLPHWPALVIRSPCGEALIKASANPTFAGLLREADYASYCDGDYVWIRNHSENEGVLEGLVKAGIVTPTPYQDAVGCVLCRILTRETPPTPAEEPERSDESTATSDETREPDPNLLAEREDWEVWNGGIEAEGDDSVLDGNDLPVALPHPTRVANPDQRLSDLYEVQDALSVLQSKLNVAIAQEERRFIPNSTIEADL